MVSVFCLPTIFNANPTTVRTFRTRNLGFARCRRHGRRHPLLPSEVLVSSDEHRPEEGPPAVVARLGHEGLGFSSAAGRAEPEVRGEPDDPVRRRRQSLGPARGSGSRQQVHERVPFVAVRLHRQPSGMRSTNLFVVSKV